MFIALLYIAMVSIGPYNFDGAIEKSALQILISP